MERNAAIPLYWKHKVVFHEVTGPTTYDFIAAIDDERLVVCIYDGDDAFCGSCRNHVDTTAATNGDSFADVGNEEIFPLIKKALLIESGENATRLIRTDSRMELRISTAWGTEFGNQNIFLDIAAIPLFKQQGNGAFVDMVFAQIVHDKQVMQENSVEKRALELEIEDLKKTRERLQRKQSIEEL